MTLINHREHFNLHHSKKISILVLCRSCRMHYNPCQYLQCGGNAGIWRLPSVVGDNPAVRERRGSFQARIFTKQDDYVKNRLWQSQREEVTGKHTHVLCCGFLVILCLQIKELGLSCFKCWKRREDFKSEFQSRTLTVQHFVFLPVLPDGCGEQLL